MLTVGTNTFISLPDADIYFAGHLEALLWQGYDEPKREAALRGSFFRISASCTWTFDPLTAPEIVKIAQCEWALELTKQQQKTSKKSVLLTEMEAGPAKMKFQHMKDDGLGGLNDWIKQMLSKACQCAFDTSTSSQNGNESSSINIY